MVISDKEGIAWQPFNDAVHLVVGLEHDEGAVGGVVLPPALVLSEGPADLHIEPLELEAIHRPLSARPAAYWTREERVRTDVNPSPWRRHGSGNEKEEDEPQ